MPLLPTKILEARARAEELWADSQAVKRYAVQPRMQTLAAVLSQQTANFGALENANNCGSVKVYWESSCDNQATIITGLQKVNSLMCAPVGNGLDSNVGIYTLDNLIQSTGYSIVDDLCENLLQRDELLAKILMKINKEIVDKLNQWMIARLISFKGANAYTGNGIVQSSVGNTYKVSSYDAVAPTLVPYLLRAAEINNMTVPFLHQGGAVTNAFYKDEKQQNTQADFGYAKMWGDLDVIEDFKGFDTLSLQNDFLLIDSGSVALVTKYAGSTEPTELVSDYYVTSMPLLGGLIRDNQRRPLMVDIFHKKQMQTIETISGVTRCVLADIYQGELKFGFFLNPLACNNNYTGVIHFQKDSTLDPVGVPATLTLLPGGGYQAVQ